MYILQGEGFDGVVVEIWSQLGGHYKVYVRNWCSWVRYYCLRAAWRFAQLLIHCVFAESLFETASVLVEMSLDSQHQQSL